jgi:hypothetical protein
MIIVTGTRRSGTSVWMQILEQGGIQVLGRKFPANWKSLMEEANPKGFFESTLVQGINFRTNPDPDSGAWIPPHKVTDIGIKIFADGLVKTDFSYITQVIFTVREWQECEASQKRMDEIRAGRSDTAGEDPNAEVAARLPAGFTWWKANFSLVRDMQMRRYPTAVFSYAALMEDPQKIVNAGFEWLGRGDANAAVGAVERSLQTQQGASIPDAGHNYGGMFDELYDALHRNAQISPSFYEKLAETDDRITQEISAILA